MFGVLGIAQKPGKEPVDDRLELRRLLRCALRCRLAHPQARVHARSELGPDVRSMLTLAMLVAYGRPNELRVHVQGAVANGVTPDQIREVMLHAMIYCGVPRAVEGFRVAADTLREMGVIQ